jgi:hypothetical protein
MEMKLVARTYDVVLQEELKSDGVQGAVKRARKKLMMQLQWPQCSTCWGPFGLNAIVLGPSQVQVYLLCERCLNNGSLNYSSRSDGEQTEDLLG